MKSPFSFCFEQKSFLPFIKTQDMLVKSVRGCTPKWGKDCFFAENSTLIGDLILVMSVLFGIKQSSGGMFTIFG